jgi:hypothetical protein
MPQKRLLIIAVQQQHLHEQALNRLNQGLDVRAFGTLTQASLLPSLTPLTQGN